jgi:hypothetical protein
MAIFLNTVLICFFYYIIGQSQSNLKNNFSNCCIKIINGSIILSFIALLSNFFLGLNLLLNSFTNEIISKLLKMKKKFSYKVYYF